MYHLCRAIPTIIIYTIIAHSHIDKNVNYISHYSIENMHFVMLSHENLSLYVVHTLKLRDSWKSK